MKPNPHEISGLAIRLGYLATQSGIKARFITAADLVMQLEKAQQLGRFETFMKRSLLSPSVLIIDLCGALGYVECLPQSSSADAVGASATPHN